MRSSLDGELDTDDDDEELAPIWTSFQFDKKLAVSANLVDDSTLAIRARTPRNMEK